jgi:hypothetical protein
VRPLYQDEQVIKLSKQVTELQFKLSLALLESWNIDRFNRSRPPTTATPMEAAIWWRDERVAFSRVRHALGVGQSYSPTAPTAAPSWRGFGDLSWSATCWRSSPAAHDDRHLDVETAQLGLANAAHQRLPSDIMRRPPAGIGEKDLRSARSNKSVPGLHRRSHRHAQADVLRSHLVPVLTTYPTISKRETSTIL